MMYFVKGEAYATRASTIQEWMSRDRLQDERIAQAKEPGAICPQCDKPMTSAGREYVDYLGGSERVAFWYKCTHCSFDRRRLIYEDGEEYVPKPTLCNECGAEMTHNASREGKVLTSTDTCPKCGHEEVSTMDLGRKRKEKPDPKFTADRKRFCMSAEEGQKYIESQKNMHQLSELMKKGEEREKKKVVYEAVAKLKKLKVPQVEELLSKAAAKQGYPKFTPGEPHMGKEVTVDFNVQDGKDAREEYDSRKDLKRLIEDALFDTNWKLMSDRISYRLGVLKGRLRALENEEDLVKMVETRKKRKR